MSPSSLCVVLIAHGSRRPEANLELVRLAERLQAERPETRFEIAYLELAEPTIPEALDRAVAHGSRRIVLLPYFLSPGAHVQGDLERFRSDFAARRPDRCFQLCPPLGSHPLMRSIVLDRLDEAASAAEPRAASPP